MANKELRQEDLNARDEIAQIYPVRFWVKYIEDDKNPDQTRGVEMVQWAKKGASITIGQQTPMRITQAMKDREIWPALKDFYEAWKAGQDAPVNGTPLSQWPGLPPEQAQRFQQMFIRSVEDVAAMTDNDIDRFGMGGIALRQNARAFVAKKTSRDSELDALKKQVADLQAFIENTPGAEPTKRRGRPPKTAEAA